MKRTLHSGWPRGMILLATMFAAVVQVRALPPQIGSNGAAIGRPTADTLPGLGAGHGQDDIPYSTREMQARQLKKLREEHQKEVAADSDRLLQLAAALKAQTDQGITASPAELKDVDQIAKLARKLSDRIRNQ